jgi:hypothetical protein
MKGCPTPWVSNQMAGVYELAGSIAFLLLGVLGLASVASLVVRFRRSQGVERQQLKWFTYGAGVLALLLAVSAASQALNDRIPALVVGPRWPHPLAIGVAVLRYRLYDIDGSSTAPWSMGCSPSCWASATPAPCLRLGSCSAAWARIRRAGW